MAGGYVQVDETPVCYLAPGNGKTKTGYFWTTSRPGGDAVYQWEISRAATCLEKVLPVDFKGTVQCDGYTAYPSFARRKEHIELAACWAHTRRKFYEARDQAPQIAGWLLRQIGHLYRIERKLRRSRSGPRLRAAVRAHQAKPVYQRLHRVLNRLKVKRHYLPRSRMGLAIDYTVNLWPLLGVYLTRPIGQIADLTPQLVRDQRHHYRWSKQRRTTTSHHKCRSHPSTTSTTPAGLTKIGCQEGTP